MNLSKKKNSEFNFNTIFRFRRYLTYGVGLIFLSLAIIVAGLIPQITESMALYNQLSTERAMEANLERKVNELQTVQATNDFSQKDLVDQVLPSKKPLLELLTGLSSSASRTQVSFTDFTVSPGEISTQSSEVTINASTSRRPRGTGSKTPKKKTSDKIDVKLTVQGSLTNVQRFFEQVESIAPFTTITSLSLNQPGRVNDDEERLVEADLVVTTYYFTQSISAALEEPLPIIGESEKEVLNAIRFFNYSSIEEQQQILGGGLSDLFGIEGLEVFEGI